MELNRREISDLFGVSLPTVDVLISKGMPILESGKKGKQAVFDSVACIEWHSQQAVKKVVGNGQFESKEEAQTRKAIADANSAELEVQKKRSEVILIEDAVRAVSNEFVAVRSGVLNSIDRVAPLALVAEDELEIKEIFKTEFEEMLIGLSDASRTVSEIASDQI